jgi:hypothetical protein
VKPISPEVRALLVKQLGAALAASYRKSQKNETAGASDHATGRDVHNGEGCEHLDSITS